MNNLFEKIQELKIKYKLVKPTKTDLISVNNIHLPFPKDEQIIKKHQLMIRDIYVEVWDKTSNITAIQAIDILLYIIQNLPFMSNDKKYQIRIFMYDNKKKVPKHKNFKQINLNSGYTEWFEGNETKYIVIYRKEEWFKVLIHELIHACHIYKLDEAQTEFLATLINICINENSKEKFLEKLEETILFGVNQSLKISNNPIKILLNMKEYKKPEVQYHILKTTLLLNIPFVFESNKALTPLEIYNLDNSMWPSLIEKIEKTNPFEEYNESMRMTPFTHSLAENGLVELE